MQPLLKNKNLDPSVLSNLSPISKLLFLAESLEQIVPNHLKSFLHDFCNYEKFQSGFKRCHSTETALLRVLNDLLLTVDSGNSAVLVLLDLTALKGASQCNAVNFLLLWPLSLLGCPKGLFWVLYCFRYICCPCVPFLGNVISAFIALQMMCKPILFE